MQGRSPPNTMVGETLSFMPWYIELVETCAEADWVTDFPPPALRFSISNDLKFDAERDLKDIDAPNIPVHALNKVSPGGISVTKLSFCSWQLLEFYICASEQKRKQSYSWRLCKCLHTSHSPVSNVWFVDKVWRHSYLRRSPVCNLLCADRREPGRRAAPDEN